MKIVTLNKKDKKLKVGENILEFKLTFLEEEKLYILDTCLDDYAILKKVYIKDCIRNIVYDIIFEENFNQNFFDSVASLEFINDKFKLSIMTKSASNDDLRHEKYTRSALLKSLIDHYKPTQQFDCEVHYMAGKPENGYSNFTITYFPLDSQTIGDSITMLVDFTKHLSFNSLMALNGNYWDENYGINEQLFTENLVLPLLRQMNLISICYNHGNKEFGKDVIFSKLDSFNNLNHYGIQIKKGNISGKVNSQIDEIIGQINDAFPLPYKQIGSENGCYINTLYVIISGYFTDNAKEKIIHKLPSSYKGSVQFIDKEKLLELIFKYWK